MANSTRPKLAGVVTTYFKYSHAQHIIDRFLDGYGWNGTHHRPAMDLVSLYVDQVGNNDLSRERGARHPRGNQAWPRVGIFAQRAKDRPNRLGLTTVEIVRVEGRTIVVRGLDDIDGTPVLDIKPVMQEFLPRTPVRQPQWSRELMRDYW